MTRILHLNLSPPGKGGIERLLVDFFDHLHGDEFDVGLCILGGESEMSRQMARRGCTIWTLNRRTSQFDWSLHARLVRALRRHRPDVLHIHGNPGLIFGVPAARWVGFRNIVYTCHFSRSPHRPLRRTFLSGLLRLVPVRVAVSEAARTVLAERYHVTASEVAVIYNGVNLRRFEATMRRHADGPVTIGFCGVFRPEKQIRLLIEAFAVLHRRGLPVRLLLVGDGPTMPECQAAVRQLGVESAVCFAGEQIDVRPFVRQMDVFVLPSSEEAMPVALLEAMALGCSVVASAVGGIPEVVEDGVSGVLVPSGDAPRLAETLATLVQDTELRHRLGRAARQRVEKCFSLDKMMERYAEIYRALAGGRVSQRGTTDRIMPPGPA